MQTQLIRIFFYWLFLTLVERNVLKSQLAQFAPVIFNPLGLTLLFQP